MANIYMNEFPVPIAIENGFHIVGLNGTENIKFTVGALSSLVATSVTESFTDLVNAGDAAVLEAAQAYADGIVTEDPTKVSKSGDTITGDLIIIGTFTLSNFGIGATGNLISTSGDVTWSRGDTVSIFKIDDTLHSVAIGINAGGTQTGDQTIFLGNSTGYGNSANFVTSVGYNSAGSNSGEYLVSLGASAAGSNTGDYCFFSGYNSGLNNIGNNSIAFGVAAGQLNEGNDVFFAGYLAGQLNEGSNSIGIGNSAANTNISDYVIGIGWQAAYGNTGTLLTALGAGAGGNNTGVNSISIGQNAGNANTGDYTFSAGYQAGRLNDGDYLIAIGYNAGYDNTGLNVTALGAGACQSNTGDVVVAFSTAAAANNSGSNLIAAGNSAGFSNSGNYNNFFGTQAGQGNTGSSVNGFGQNAFYENTGNHANAFGQDAGKFNTGTYNNFFGLAAGQSCTGANVTAFGLYAGRMTSESNAFILGNFQNIYFNHDEARTALGTTLATVVIQTAKSEAGTDSSAATSILKFAAARGTGNADSGNVVFQRAVLQVSGTDRHTLEDAIIFVGNTGQLVNTKADYIVDNDAKGLVLKSSDDDHYYRYTAGIAGVLTITDIGTSY